MLIRTSAHKFCIRARHTVEITFARIVARSRSVIFLQSLGLVGGGGGVITRKRDDLSHVCVCVCCVRSHDCAPQFIGSPFRTSL